MLAVVKNPHIEISLSGKITEVTEIISFLRSRYSVDVLTDTIDDVDDIADEYVKIEDTDFWKETTSGDLLMGYRLKHEMTQEELSTKCGIHQVVISEYETGKRKLTQKAAIKIGKALNENPKKFFL